MFAFVCGWNGFAIPASLRTIVSYFSGLVPSLVGIRPKPASQLNASRPRSANDAAMFDAIVHGAIWLFTLSGQRRFDAPLARSISRKTRSSCFFPAYISANTNPLTDTPVVGQYVSRIQAFVGDVMFT